MTISISDSNSDRLNLHLYSREEGGGKERELWIPLSWSLILVGAGESRAL
jgi:hypothetical protein